jgi:hypothetical protein
VSKQYKYIQCHQHRNLLHFHCKNSGYVIERKNGFVAEKPIKPVQCVQFVSVTAGET